MQFETEKELRKAVEKEYGKKITDSHWGWLTEGKNLTPPYDDTDVGEILSGIYGYEPKK